jgi:hypothetical protein
MRASAISVTCSLVLLVAAVTPAEARSAVRHDDLVEVAEAPRPPDPTPAPPARDELDARWRLAGAIGVGFGSFLVDGHDVGTVTQGHLDGGLRNGRLLVFAGYDLMSLTLPADALALRGVLDPSNGRGLMHRLGANARYSYGRAGCRDTGVDLWAEAGVGIEHVRWDAGGTWSRPDLALGLGASWWGLGEKQHGGLSAGLRITLARRDDVAGAAVACGGPCDVATPPTGWDRSFLFDVKLMFGK